MLRGVEIFPASGGYFGGDAGPVPSFRLGSKARGAAAGFGALATAEARPISAPTKMATARRSMKGWGVGFLIKGIDRPQDHRPDQA